LLVEPILFRVLLSTVLGATVVVVPTGLVLGATVPWLRVAGPGLVFILDVELIGPTVVGKAVLEVGPIPPAIRPR